MDFTISSKQEHKSRTQYILASSGCVRCIARLWRLQLSRTKARKTLLLEGLGFWNHRLGGVEVIRTSQGLCGLSVDLLFIAFGGSPCLNPCATAASGTEPVGQLLQPSSHIQQQTWQKSIPVLCQSCLASGLRVHVPESGLLRLQGRYFSC